MPSSTPDVAQHSAAARSPRWVVRGGLSAPIHLQDGYREHLGAPGIFGFSVQHQIGLTIEQLAAAGRFRHTHISYVTESEAMVKKLAVDFNSMMRDEHERVYIGREGAPHEDQRPLMSLRDGETVVLSDGEMEVDATVEFAPGRNVWFGRPEWATRRDGSSPLVAAEAVEAGP